MKLLCEKRTYASVESGAIDMIVPVVDSSHLGAEHGLQASFLLIQTH